jgi:hypothetical protein
MTRALRPKFKAAGYPIPAKVRVSCAWPSSHAVSRKHRSVGECWDAKASTSGHVEIFISPTLADGVKVAGTLVHELLHASLETANPDKSIGHGAAFKAGMGPLGMTGKATATTEGAALKAELTALVRKIGRYPHAELKFAQRPGKTQTTRLLKVECPDCGYVVRTTAKWIEVGCPSCPCGEKMEVAA